MVIAYLKIALLAHGYYLNTLLVPVSTNSAGNEVPRVKQAARPRIRMASPGVDVYRVCSWASYLKACMDLCYGRAAGGS